MDLTWLKDYGALLAASIAAAVAITNGVLQARRDRAFKTGEWLREVRIPRYVAFIRAAYEHLDATFFQYGEHLPHVMGPTPSVLPDFVKTEDQVRHQMAEMRLVGPAEVTRTAQIVQYALWRYASQLERDPFDFDQTLVFAAIEDFTSAAQEALGVSGREAAEDLGIPDFGDWLKEINEQK